MQDSEPYFGAEEDLAMVVAVDFVHLHLVQVMDPLGALKATLANYFAFGLL